MELVPLKSELVASLSAAFQRRLLHPGASTANILRQYVATVKVLQALDPSGICHEKVGEPVRQYLQYVVSCGGVRGAGRWGLLARPGVVVVGPGRAMTRCGAS